MKKFMLCVALLLTFCVATAFIVERNTHSRLKNHNNISTPTEKVKKEEREIKTKKCVLKDPSETEKYMLKEYEGSIAIFKDNSNLPLRKTSILVKELPEKDREMLKKGIDAYSKEELNILLEDYCS